MDSSELYSQAREARRDGDRKKSEELFRKIIDQYPDSREAVYARGQLADLMAAQDSTSQGYVGTYKHISMDWESVEIIPEELALHQATCTITPDSIYIKSDEQSGTNVIVDMNHRRIETYAASSGVGGCTVAQIDFDDIEDVRGSLKEFKDSFRWRFVHPPGSISLPMPIPIPGAKMQSYNVVVKTKQGAFIEIAKGVRNLESRGGGWFNDDINDTIDGATKLENELRKMIFMP